MEEANVSPIAQEVAPEEHPSLAALARMFLRLGLTAFGGPAAHIAMMEAEMVRRRHWLTHEKFLDLLGASNLMPGPTSTEMALQIGYLRCGLPGLLTAGACFIAPAGLLVWAIAWAYVRFGHLPQVAGVLYGVKPVVIAIVLQALVSLLPKALKTRMLTVIGVVSAAAVCVGVGGLAVLFGAGTAAGVGWWVTPGRRGDARPLAVILVIAALLLFGPFILASRAAAHVGAKLGLLPLFLFFLKVGSVLYGSGYVLLAFLRADLVTRWHWLTSAQLLDATAIGQVTPGPLFTTATFIGYVLGGTKGAIVSTVGIFLPAFIFVWISGPLITRLRNSPLAGAFLDGVNAAALALMAVVMWQLGRAAIVDATTVVLVVSSAILLFHYRVNSAWLAVGGALFGLVAAAMGQHLPSIYQ